MSGRPDAAAWSTKKFGRHAASSYYDSTVDHSPGLFLRGARRTWRASVRRRILRAAWSSSPGLFLSLTLWAVVNAVVPVAMIISVGHLVAAVPAATRDGLSSSAGHHLRASLVVFAALFAGSLVLGPVQTGLAAIVRVRFTYEMQDGLLQSLSRPTGIEHLEDPDLLDRIALAKGTLMSVFVADAPMALAQVLSSRLGGALACFWIGLFRWWIAVLLVGFWLTVRYRLIQVPKAQVRAFVGNAGIMRRAEYFNELATRPESAKENRVFGLGSWIIDELRRHWRDAMAAAWVQQRRFYEEICGSRFRCWCSTSAFVHTSRTRHSSAPHRSVRCRRSWSCSPERSTSAHSSPSTTTSSGWARRCPKSS